MRALAYPLALVIVAGASAGAVALAVGARTWSRWLLRTGGAVGVVGLLVTVVAAVNLLVPRTCGEAETAAGTLTEVNRPLLSVVVDDGACRKAGVAQVEVALLAGVTTSAAALVGRVRR